MASPYCFAHGGSTDSSGGHTDRSTGEYHYHHGHPAHDHTDKDGDGDLDCPYSFTDTTDHSRSSGSTGYSSRVQDYSEDLDIVEAASKSSQTKDDSSNFLFYVLGFIVYVFLFFILPAILS